MSKKSISTFFFEQHTVRVAELNGEPWFVMKDVCEILEIVNSRSAAARLEDYQKSTATFDTNGGRQTLTLVSESGIYFITLASRKPVARVFKRWITTELLPSIRTNGFYVPSKADERAARVLNADDPIRDRHQKTPNMRFFEEVKRFERNNNCTFVKAAEHIISKNTLKALELGGSILKVMSRGDNWLYLLSMGFDLPYVIWGQWGLTDSERQMRDLYRRASPEQRAHIRGQFEHVALTLPAALPLIEVDDD